jgi:hypothetical protein
MDIRREGQGSSCPTHRQPKLVFKEKQYLFGVLGQKCDFAHSPGSFCQPNIVLGLFKEKHYLFGVLSIPPEIFAHGHGYQTQSKPSKFLWPSCHLQNRPNLMHIFCASSIPRENLSLLV